MLFAWLAYKKMKNEKVDLRKITGSSKPQVLGTLYSV
jgi:1,6-anhydro-N-acetylmuramate kinase